MIEFGLLRKIGLTDGEIKVYLALLKLGQTTVGPIGSESKVSKSKLYDILEKLSGKGLAGSIIKNGTKYFSASNPRMIVEYLNKQRAGLDETRIAVEKLLPVLETHRASLGQKRIAELYEGFHGLKAVREELLLTLKKGEELLVLVAPKLANEKWEPWFIDFHRRREARGVRMRIIYNKDAAKFGEKRKQLKHTKVRYLPNEMISPNWIDVYKDAILFVLVIQDAPVSLVIRDKSLAESFRSYFDIVWSTCTENLK